MSEKLYKDYREFRGLGASVNLNLPAGPTGNRPVSPATGSLYYNTTLETIEWYDGSSWVAPSLAGTAALTLNQIAVGDSSNTISSSADLTFDGSTLRGQSGTSIMGFKLGAGGTDGYMSYGSHILKLGVDNSVDVASFSQSAVSLGYSGAVLSLIGSGISVPGFAGAGTRMVVAQAGGGLTTQTISPAYTNEEAQDAVGTILSSEFTYDDLTPAISINTIGATKVIGTKTSTFISDFASAADARIAVQKANPNGLASLDSGGKVPASQLPAIAITNVSVVANIAARDALTPNTGDVAKVLDTGGGIPHDYIYDGSVWIQLTDSAPVSSVNGLTGAVTLTTSNIAEGSNLYYSDERAQDAVAAMINAGTHTGISFSYNDVANSISATVTGGGGGVTDHGALTGLSDDDHAQYAFLAGRSGGQTYNGGVAAAENLLLKSTNHATKGSIFFGDTNNGWDDANKRLGIGTGSPANKIHIEVSTGLDQGIFIKNTGTSSSDTAALKLENQDGYATWFLANSSGLNALGMYFQQPKFYLLNGGASSVFEVLQNGNITVPLGTMQINNLAGTGTRMVTATSAGLLGTSAIPTGTVTSVGASITGSTALSIAGSPVTTSGTLAFTWTGSGSQYIKGDGTLATFPTAVSTFTNDAGYLTSQSSDINNQNASGQTANFWITGSGRLNSLRVDGLNGTGTRLASLDLNGSVARTSVDPANLGLLSATQAWTGANDFQSGVTMSGLATNASDRILGLRNSDGSVAKLALGSNLAISSQTLGFTPAGSNQQVQYNLSGALAANANFTFDYTNNTLNVTGNMFAQKTGVNQAGGTQAGLFFNTASFNTTVTQTAGAIFASMFGLYTENISATTTYPNSTIHSANANLYRIGSAASAAATVSQGSGGGRRAASANAVMLQFDSVTNSAVSSIDHVAGMQIFAPQATNGSGVSTASLVAVTNYYGLLIGDSAEYANSSAAITNKFAIYQAGANDTNILASTKNSIGHTNTPTSALDITGTAGSSQLRLRTSFTPTGSADAAGNTGEHAWDDNYVYVKTSAGWKRSALSTF